MDASTVRRLLLEVLDPTAGACTLVIARLVDAAPEVSATEDDIVTLATAALTSGDVPIGPIEYVVDELDYSIHPDAPVATIAMGSPGVTMLLGLALGDAGCIGVGGSRYGHLPHLSTVQDPSAVLLPDIEAALAELVVYTRERARLIDYTGRVEASMEMHAPGPIVPYVIDPESGIATAGAPLAGFEMLRFSYSLDMSTQEIEGAVYEAAQELARRFGSDAPQFLRPPSPAPATDASTDAAPGPTAGG